ncbi:sulfatase-like hydrolase/transferase [Sandarakinorhabdus sp.]|uniref:sulfatase-like hydrolase/transferase n=1 Tax=Sandarakinorhabdus sp. TaxID=1916663 RepID=UPI00286E79EA|nr:sulfatase-like hydrolase/transferase [Sandarakinorhabdus sp.]
MGRFLLIISLLLAATIVADALVRPRGRRSLAGLWLHLWIILATGGLVQLLFGNALVAGLVALGVVALLAVVSNAKNAMLGEQLLFSDLALVVAVFRHPQFYLSALTSWQLAALIAGALAAAGLLAWQFVFSLTAHLTGLAQMLVAVLVIRISLALPPWRGLAVRPDARADMARHGLLGSLLLYWWRWRRSIDPPVENEALLVPTVQLVVVVQCESFADPAELFGDPALALPGLAAARGVAWVQGRLLVSGFGAYTNRTEYGVLFGRDEDELGFRRYDPYLTALGEASHALPARLGRAGWRSLFVHPHDLGFYSRDLIMPAAGFAELVGPEAFCMPARGEHRYVSDAAIADVILDRAGSAAGPGLIHAVTIENHGPWPADDGGSYGKRSSAYLKLVCKGDAMLTRLIAGMAALKRPALLLFYGDHRPSIAGLVDPGGDRDTPYVLLRFGPDGALQPGAGPPRDLSPAQLHHLLVETITA